jgi:hypothetical protein
MDSGSGVTAVVRTLKCNAQRGMGAETLLTRAGGD